MSGQLALFDTETEEAIYERKEYLTQQLITCESQVIMRFYREKHRYA
jgi:hypothetical protein